MVVNDFTQGRSLVPAAIVSNGPAPITALVAALLAHFVVAVFTAAKEHLRQRPARIARNTGQRMIVAAGTIFAAGALGDDVVGLIPEPIRHNLQMPHFPLPHFLLRSAFLRPLAG